MLKPIVDRDMCISCGLCVDLAPEVFQLDDEGLSAVVGEVTAENEGAVIEAIEACPTQAIQES